MSMTNPSFGDDITSPAQRVSDARLRRLVGYNLKRAFNVVRADLTRTLEPLGLRMITYSALVLIVDNPGLRPSQLADALAIERPNTVLIVDELESRKLIRRERDPNDRRAYALKATPAGRRLCQRAVKADDEHEAALLAGISDADREAFIRVLAEIERAGKWSSA